MSIKFFIVPTLHSFPFSLSLSFSGVCACCTCDCINYVLVTPTGSHRASPRPWWTAKLFPNTVDLQRTFHVDSFFSSTHLLLATCHMPHATRHSPLVVAQVTRNNAPHGLFFFPFGLKIVFSVRLANFRNCFLCLSCGIYLVYSEIAFSCFDIVAQCMKIRAAK